MRIVAVEEPFAREHLLQARELVAARLVERPARMQIGVLDRGVARRPVGVEILAQEVLRGERAVSARPGVPAVHVARRGKVGERAAQSGAARRIGDEQVRRVHLIIGAQSGARPLTGVKPLRGWPLSAFSYPANRSAPIGARCAAA